MTRCVPKLHDQSWGSWLNLSAGQMYEKSQNQHCGSQQRHVMGGRFQSITVIEGPPHICLSRISLYCCSHLLFKQSSTSTSSKPEHLCCILTFFLGTLVFCDQARCCAQHSGVQMYHLPHVHCQ